MANIFNFINSNNSLSVYIFSDFLFVVAVYQFWVIISVFNELLFISMKYLWRFQAKNFKYKKFNIKIFKSIFPCSMEDLVSSIYVLWINSKSGIFYAQVGEVNSISSYLFSIKIMNIIKQFSNAPFYSKLPQFNKLFILDKIDELKNKVQKSMLISHLTFVFSFMIIGFFLITF